MSNPAETYESYMVPVLFAPWASRLLQSVNVKPDAAVLDVGCGTGIVARSLASQIGTGGRIIGLDSSTNMLAVAREAGSREGLSIEWQEGRVEQLPFPDRTFDLVLCQFSLMFFADRSTALSEMYRVLEHAGSIFLSVWQGLDQHPFYQKLHDVIQSRLGMSGVEEIFSLGDSVQLRRLLAVGGFRQVDIEPASMTARFPDPEGFLAGEIAVDTASIPSMQQLDDEARHAIIAAISEEMAAPLQQVIQDNHVVLPFHALIVRSMRD